MSIGTGFAEARIAQSLCSAACQAPGMAANGYPCPDVSFFWSPSSIEVMPSCIVLVVSGVIFQK
jgi:hypothetical protein